MPIGDIEIIEGSVPELRALINGKLREDNIARFHRAPPHKPFNVIQKNEKGEMIGVAVVGAFWDWLYLDVFRVEEAYRGQGIGTRLMESVEARAQQIGAAGIYLFTGSFQAPVFYEKRGYVRFGQLDDCPFGYQRIGYLKRFATSLSDA